MLALVAAGTLLKLLLFPAYHSTDFDVHRNWLALTHALPRAEWYYEATSPWTLDYPPLFAFFEHALSRCVPDAARRDGCLALVAEDGLYGWPTVVFQRATVVASELLLVAALRCVDRVSAALIFASPAWLLLDHIHFQYNGMLYGLMLLSLTTMLRGRYLWSAFLFATLLCFKHLYLYVAPAYVAYLARHYLWRERSLVAVLKLGAATLLPFAAALLPFAPSTYPQILRRLFPFARGLTHSYWAPNAWALYSFADRALGFARGNSLAASTRGIVGQVAFANLPQVGPRATFVLSLAFQLLAVLFASGADQFVECVCLCGFASFLFGYHVHEKAVLTVLVPFTLIARKNQRYLNAYLPLLAAGCCGLFPLIYTPSETIFKFVYTFGYCLVACLALPAASHFSVYPINVLYLLGLAAVMPLSLVVPFVFEKYEFAGNMMVSVYCATGVVLSWLQFSVAVFRRRAVQAA